MLAQALRLPQTRLSLQAILLALTVFTIPLSTSLGGISYMALVSYALIDIHHSNRWHALVYHPLTKAFWLFFALVLVGLLYSQVPMKMAFLTGKKYFWIFCTPILFVSLETKNRRDWAFMLYLGVIVLTLCYSYGMYFKTRDFAASAVFKDHIIQNLILVVGLAIALYRLLFESNHRYTYLSLVFVLTANMLLISDSITGYLLVVMCYGFVGLYLIKQKQIALKKAVIPVLCVIICIGVTIALSPPLQNRVINEYSFHKAYQNGGNQYTSTGVRLNAWRLGFHFIQQKPILGYGTGGLFRAYTDYLTAHPNPDIKADKLNDIGYINVSIQYGLVGLALLAYFFYQLFKCSLYQAPFERFLIQFILCVMLVMFSINPWMTSSAPTHLFSLFFALCFRERTS